MLDYDNSAFYYFALTVLGLYLLPAGYFVLSEVCAAFIGGSSGDGKPRTALEKQKAEKLRQKTSGFARLSKLSFVIHFVLVLLALVAFFYLMNQVRNDGEVQRFDPFQILGVEMDAEMSVIKKAYRRLSLQYHPDKNPGDKIAEEMFMKVAKAYEALTDEVAKENMRLYGNPDGKQALEVSIGLPRILLDNPKVVMVLYLIAMVVIIPVAVGLWYANSKQYGEKNIKYETYSIFYQLLSENHHAKMLPEVLTASAECRALFKPVLGDDAAAMGRLAAKLKNDKLMLKPKYDNPAIMHNNLLLHAHMLRLADVILTPQLRKDMDALLCVCPELVDGMTEIATQRRWLNTVVATIRLQQHLAQALWFNDSPLLQLPHITETELKHMTRGGGGKLQEYLRVPDADKKGLAGLTDEQRADVLAACEVFPRLQVDLKVFVEEPEEEEEQLSGEIDDKIYEGDLVTLRVTLTRLHVSESSVAPPVHAPYFPRPLRENYWLVLTDRPPGAKGRGLVGADSGAPTLSGNMHAVEKLTDQKRQVVHELRFGAPPRAGEYTMELHVLSNSYIGFDESFEFKFTVLPASQLPVYTPHPEDVELDNEPTLFEQMLAANMDEDSSDDEDEKTNKKSVALSANKKEEESGSDSD